MISRATGALSESVAGVGGSGVGAAIDDAKFNPADFLSTLRSSSARQGRQSWPLGAKLRRRHEDRFCSNDYIHVGGDDGCEREHPCTQGFASTGGNGALHRRRALWKANQGLLGQPLLAVSSAKTAIGVMKVSITL